MQELSVSELSKEPPIPDEPIESEGPAARGIMLVTMLLLIAGFLMTGIMLFHYGYKAKHPDTPFPALPLASLKEKGKAYAAKLKPPEKAEAVAEAEQPAETKPADAGLGKLFSGRGDSVRWPKLKLTGFGSSTDGGGGFAIINGDQVHPGQLIDGKVKLVEIRAQDVVVEYMGETQTLTVDVQKH
jgi:hypothetical protein